MTRWDVYWKRAVRHLAVALVVGGVGVLGCGKAEPPRAQSVAADEPRAAAAEEPVIERPGIPKAPAQEAVEDALHHPFSKAVRALNDPPLGCAVPPATAAGLPVYKVYQSVVAQWDGIRFITADGKPMHYSATIYTAYGEIEIELRPDLAPNHVRSFVALARAHYYDQLFFDHVNHEEYPDNPSLRNDLLEAGSPTGGEGDDSFGSVGYWLYPETVPSEKATHVEGTVGAYRGIEKDSAACRFYINMARAPFNDGNYTIFGQVTHGMDVARKIFEQPVSAEDQAMHGHYGLLRPANPVMIQKVVIHTSEDGAEGKK